MPTFLAAKQVPRIPNHRAARLSALDLAMIRTVPPGGNWKDIPETIPSRRLEQIRSSYAAGRGSRSTYYGRLHPDAPAYTINTFFSRPGNGCHIHYEQDRVLSPREAARLQSFPDSFVFSGGQTAVAAQIGNAVPPLLAFQIALGLRTRGEFVDLFAGAGGLSLGFVWAGWQPLVASDIDRHALETYYNNIHKETVHGDIRADGVMNEIVSIVARSRTASRPLWLLGGPPCQGFSTAGKRRSIDDQRNRLFEHYVRLLATLRPAGFVFENVTGLLSMAEGRAFAEIRAALEAPGYSTTVWKLRSEEYGIPQRRTRIVVMGTRRGDPVAAPPTPVTRFLQGSSLPVVFSVREALSDLPSIEPGFDGSDLEFSSDPANCYQQFMRGRIPVTQLLQSVTWEAR